MSERINKARYWSAILYPENMVDGWQDLIGDLLQLPGCYCIHDRDLDKDGDDRKIHVHIMIAFPNTTTHKHAMSVFGLLSSEGKKALSTCEAIISVRQMYSYLIHDTPGSIKQGKFRYSETDRILFNNFDIGIYEQLSESDRLDILSNLFDYIKINNIIYFSDLYDFVSSQNDSSLLLVFTSYSSVLDRLCRSNYVRYRDTELSNQSSI